MQSRVLVVNDASSAAPRRPASSTSSPVRGGRRARERRYRDAVRDRAREGQHGAVQHCISLASPPSSLPLPPSHRKSLARQPLHQPLPLQVLVRLAVVHVALLVLELLGQLGVAELGAAFLLELLGDCAEGRVRRGSGELSWSARHRQRVRREGKGRRRTRNGVLDARDLVEVLRVGQSERAHPESVPRLLEVALKVFAARGGSVCQMLCSAQPEKERGGRTGPGRRGRSRSRTCTRRRAHAACTASTGSACRPTQAAT